MSFLSRQLSGRARQPFLCFVTRSPLPLSSPSFSHRCYSTNSSSSSTTAPSNNTISIDPFTWKDTAFDLAKRDELGLRGLLPPALQNMEDQIERTLHQLRGKKTELGKNIYLTALRQTNVRLFYATIMRNAEECLPLIYTPVVGEACQKVSTLIHFSLSLSNARRFKTYLTGSLLSFVVFSHIS